MTIITTEIITFGRMIVIVGMIMIEDGVTNIINTDIIIMVGVTESEIMTILGEEVGMEIEGPTTAMIGIMGLDIPTDPTMTDRIMIAPTMAVPLGGRFLIANACK